MQAARVTGARRAPRPYHQSKSRPTGPRWQEYAKLLWRKWGPAPLCYYCRHPVLPGCGEIAHLISPVVRPDLAWAPDNLVPSHGGGRRRCQEPSCSLNCNWLAAVSPDYREKGKDEDGRDLPFTPEFLARQARESARNRAKRAKRSPFPANPRSSKANGKQPIRGTIPPPPPPAAGEGDYGRDW